MDMSVIFEQLAMMTHGNPKLNQIFQQLPSNIRDVIHENDSLKLRSLISGYTYFPDAVRVANK